MVYFALQRSIYLSTSLLEATGMMIIEHSKYTKLDHLPHFSFKKSYGGSIFSFFEIDSSEEDKNDDNSSEEA